MADKNENPDAIDATQLEHHVDQMMDPKLPDSAASAPKIQGVPEVPGDASEIDIFKGQSQAEAETVPVHEQPAESQDAVRGSVDTDSTDEVVDDIVAHEGDELLAKQDEDIVKAFVSGKPSANERIKTFFRDWWDNRFARYAALAALIVIIATAATIPASRYVVLNAAGVRVTASMTILDDTTSLPLKNVSVTVGDTTQKSNADGVVHLESLKLGAQPITVKQLGFAAISKTVTLGLGSNPLGEFSLKAVGTQYKFSVTDYVSGKPVASAVAINGDANAQADDKGRIVLTIGKLTGATLDVTVSANGYRSEKVSLDAAATALTNVVMTTSKKEVFVSKQSGKYDVYKIDVDGKNKQLLLAGTGIERPQITLIPHPTDNVVALVSSRDNKRNQDGYLLDTLTLINVDTGAVLSLDQSEQIKIVDWVNDKLIYVKVKAGTSAGNAERYQLMSYDYSSTKRLQLAGANYFADIVSAKGVLYYATGNYYQPGQSQFVRINPDNTGRQTLLSEQVWTIIRTGYNDLYLAGAYTGNTQSWYSYHMGDSSAKKLSQAPADANTSRFYLDAPDAKRALWTESRDGKGVLLAYDDSSKKDTTLLTQSGLTSPLRWLDSRTVVYHIVTPQETAAYVVSLDGGTPHKISDVTNIAGLGQWNPGY
jgi:Tol biopolymer transport system component